MGQQFDALLLVSFGGPEKAEDIMPFLRNVTRGRNVPEERLLEVAEHYHHLGGRSPINDQCRALIASIKTELSARGWDLPIYWGNRNWHPFLVDTVGDMIRDGTRSALAVVTSMFGSYSSCRRYLEDIEEARRHYGQTAPKIARVRLGFNHPGFIEAVADRTLAAYQSAKRAGGGEPRLIFTAHSIPQAMAAKAPYVAQLQESCRLVAEKINVAEWRLAFQSRSGPLHIPWLEPDISDVLREMASEGDTCPVVVVPIGFLSDHAEVLYDLDVEAAGVAAELGIPFFRAATVGTHPAFVKGLCDMIEERLRGEVTRRVIGMLPPCPDECPVDCCPPR